MERHKHSKAITRAVAAMSALAVLVGGITFAALQSQRATLKGNSIQTATANLQLSSDNQNFSSSIDGYVFGNVMPGGAPSPATGYPIYLKNNGSTPLALSMGVSDTIVNTDSINLDKTHIILTPTDGGTSLSMSLRELTEANSHGGAALANAGHLMPGQVASYRLQFSMETDAVFGPGASLSNIDFNFNAVASS